MKNELMQFAERFEAVAAELSRRLTARGVGIVQTLSQAALPANSWALDEIAAVLVRLANVFQVKIGGRRTLKEVVEASGYTSYDSSILERCALVGGRERNTIIEIFSIEHFDHDPTDAEIEAEYMQRGLGRPEADHAVHFGEQHQQLPVEGRHIIFYLKNPIPDADGSRRVLRLWRDGAWRGLLWRWLRPRFQWRRSGVFAGVRE